MNYNDLQESSPLPTKPPYKVTKASTTPPKPARLLIPCVFTDGPYNAQERKVPANEHRLPPELLKVEGSHRMVYRLLPGTRSYIWRMV